MERDLIESDEHRDLFRHLLALRDGGDGLPPTEEQLAAGYHSTRADGGEPTFLAPGDVPDWFSQLVQDLAADDLVTPADRDGAPAWEPTPEGRRRLADWDARHALQ